MPAGADAAALPVPAQAGPGNAVQQGLVNGQVPGAAQGPATGAVPNQPSDVHDLDDYVWVKSLKSDRFPRGRHLHKDNVFVEIRKEYEKTFHAAAEILKDLVVKADKAATLRRDIVDYAYSARCNDCPQHWELQSRSKWPNHLRSAKKILDQHLDETREAESVFKTAKDQRRVAKSLRDCDTRVEKMERCINRAKLLTADFNELVH
ncbi:hypothetical protein LTR56_012947 [Elasticomyces elasticus]|nr:hypothetical protein LTR56_012947 [Elasticomyces elasticus]KAK3667983.1 hypothetical protein LTR22_001050 [Elasticomyces elasticus]KAK4925076.1 hypothetical protein LTR49_007849 [Elasticomyces elasticus]KAK5767623.1 hypothetical protein LTS12_002124 [Elasticomyces elasticus]